MTPSPARTRLLVVGSLCLLAGGCPSPIPYQPNTQVLEELSPERARELLSSTVQRSVEPPVVLSEVHDDYLGYVYKHLIHGPFGIPVGRVERGMQLYYVNLHRLQLWDNHYVYIYGYEERLLARLRFASGEDASSFADLLMSFRARRIFGSGREGTQND